MVHLGAFDRDRLLLPYLEERGRQGLAINNLPAYVAGLASVSGAMDAEQILGGWRGYPDLALPTLLTIWRVGPSDKSVGWIIEDLESGR